jgi:UDP-N-acetyl-D-glucosamine dehydrogenase
LPVKKDIDDYSESSLLPILTKLTKAGANWTVVDLHVKEFKWNGKLVKTKELHEVKIEEADLVLITTNHSAFDFEMVAERAKVIFDTRNAVKK